MLIKVTFRLTIVSYCLSIIQLCAMDLRQPLVLRTMHLNRNAFPRLAPALPKMHKEWYEMNTLESLRGNLSPIAQQNILALGNNSEIGSAIAFIILSSDRVFAQVMENLLPHDRNRQQEFVQMPLIQAFSWYTQSYNLSQSPVTRQPVTFFFKLTKEQRDVLEKVYNEANKIVSVTRDEQRTIMFLPIRLTREIKDYTLMVTPEMRDYAVRGAALLAKSCLNRAIVVFASQLCFSYGLDEANSILQSIWVSKGYEHTLAEMRKLMDINYYKTRGMVCMLEYFLKTKLPGLSATSARAFIVDSALGVMIPTFFPVFCSAATQTLFMNIAFSKLVMRRVALQEFNKESNSPLKAISTLSSTASAQAKKSIDNSLAAGAKECYNKSLGFVQNIIDYGSAFSFLSNIPSLNDPIEVITVREMLHHE